MSSVNSSMNPDSCSVPEKSRFEIYASVEVSMITISSSVLY